MSERHRRRQSAGWSPRLVRSTPRRTRTADATGEAPVRLAARGPRPATVAEISAVRGGGVPRRNAGVETYEAALARAVERAQREAEALEQSRAVAPALAANLLQLAPDQQLLKVRNHARYQTWGLAEHLLEQARSTWADDADRAEQQCRLAAEIARSMVPVGGCSMLAADLRGRALGYRANVLRIKGRLQEAGTLFAEAERALAEGSGDSLEHGQLLDLKASLMVALGEPRAAADLLAQVIDLYERCEDGVLLGRGLIKLAVALRELGEPEAALPVLHRAATLLDADAEPRLQLCALHNEVVFLLECGQVNAAAERLPALRRRALAIGNRHDLLRLRWLAGAVARHQGQLLRAEALWLEARAGFLAAGLSVEVAQLGLDLASLCLELGRPAQARAFIAEVRPLFAAAGMRRDALAALLLLERTMACEVVGKAALKRAARLLREVGLTGFRRLPGAGSAALPGPG